MFHSNSLMWLVAAVLDRAALDLGTRFRLPDWVRLGAPTGIKERKMSASGCAWHPISGLGSQVEQRIEPVWVHRGLWKHHMNRTPFFPGAGCDALVFSILLSGKWRHRGDEESLRRQG